MLNADCTCGCEAFCYFKEYITGAAAGITVAIAVNKKKAPLSDCPLYSRFALRHSRIIGIKPICAFVLNEFVNIIAPSIVIARTATHIKFFYYPP